MKTSGVKAFLTLVATALFVFGVSASHADIASDMKDFYSSMGSNVAVEPAKLYKGQSATYGSLGGFGARSPVKNFQPLTISPPNVKAGCGGIDAYLGGFSFVNTDQFVQYIQAIGNNATGFAFQLAMDVISPQVSSIMTKIRETADWAKGLSTNSCEAARLLVKGSAATLGIRSSYCESDAVTTGKASGTDQAKYMCQDDAFFKSMGLDNYEKSETNKNRPDSKEIFGNLVWEGLKKNGGTANKDFAMAVMNVAGTVVVYPEEANLGERGYIPPKLELKKLLEGADENLPIFSCSDSGPQEKCANVSYGATTNPSALKKEIQAKLNSIADKITNVSSSPESVTLTSEEMGLVNMTRVPVYGMLQYATDVSPSMAKSMIHKITEYLSTYVMVRYLDAAMLAAQDAVIASKMNGADIEKMRAGLDKNINANRKMLVDAMTEMDKKLGTEMEIINQYNYLRSLAFEKYAPDIQKRISFAKALTRQNRTTTKSKK